MLIRVEPTGCCERKGMVRIRFCMYLERGDYGYAWQNNPFHNHFIYVEPDTTDEEIMDIGEAFLDEAYIKWDSGLNLASSEYQLRNDALPFKKPLTVNKARLKAIADKVKHLKTTVLERTK